MSASENTTLPSFSIVMPCYNVEKFVAQAIISTFKQKYDGHIQYVIVDDSSSDNTWEVIQQTVETEGKGLDVILIKHDKNQGVAAATDTAYQHAKGDWIIKADSDDVQLPTRCATYASLIKKYPKVGCIILSCQRMDEDETPLEHVPYCGCSYEDAKQETYLDSPEKRYLNMIKGSFEPTFYALGGTTAIKREIYEKWGTLMADARSDIRFSDDIVWAGRYILSAPVLGSKEFACMYRTRTSGNLEYRRKSSTFASFMCEELESTHNMNARAEGYGLCCLAADRALQNPSLTDWEPEQIRAHRSRNHGEEIYYAARANWWKWGWWQRLCWWRKNRKKLIAPHQAWCMRRLLPLRLVCILKTLRYH